MEARRDRRRVPGAQSRDRSDHLARRTVLAPAADRERHGANGRRPGCRRDHPDRHAAAHVRNTHCDTRSAAHPGPTQRRDPEGAGTMTLALEGVRLIDFGQYLAGPFGPMVIGDLGAEVIKVEPVTGDSMRMAT